MENTEKRIGFCKECGEKLLPESVYCFACGVKVENDEDIEEKEWNKMSGEDFRVRRCPSCGEGIPSFVAICPACGNELHAINNKEIVKEFASEVKKYEEKISANQKIRNAGWDSWGIFLKIGFVILSLLLWLIPVGIYVIWWLFHLKEKPELKEEERNLVALIENFTVPNDRESVLEALVYVKEKADFVSKERLHQKSYFWLNLWSWKAEQLKQRADIILANDSVARQSYEEILKDKERVDKKIRMRMKLLGAACVIGVLFWFLQSGRMTDFIRRRKAVEIPKTGLGRLIPEIRGGKGKIRYDHEGDFKMEYYNISEETFEKYREACNKKGFTVDVKKTYFGFEAYNEQGYKIQVTSYDGDMDIWVKNKIEMARIIWPKTKMMGFLPKPDSNFGRIESQSDTYLYLYIGNTTKEEFQEYVNRCIEYGFNQKIYQTEDNRFSAKNEEGCSLNLRYEGFKTMVIHMSQEEK